MSATPKFQSRNRETFDSNFNGVAHMERFLFRFNLVIEKLLIPTYAAMPIKLGCFNLVIEKLLIPNCLVVATGGIGMKFQSRNRETFDSNLHLRFSDRLTFFVSIS